MHVDFSVLVFYFKKRICPPFYSNFKQRKQTHTGVDIGVRYSPQKIALVLASFLPRKNWEFSEILGH